jgi:hypothetical protein
MKRFCILLLVILLAKIEASAQYTADIIVTREGIVFDTAMRDILLNLDKKKYSKITVVFKEELVPKHINERTAYYSIVNDSIIKTSYSNWTKDEMSNNSPNCGTLVIRDGYLCEKIADNNVQPTITHKDSAGYKITYSVRCFTDSQCNYGYRRERFDEMGRLSSKYEMYLFPFPTLFKYAYTGDSVKTDSLFYYNKNRTKINLQYVQTEIVKKYDAMHTLDSNIIQFFKIDSNGKLLLGGADNIVIHNTYNSAGLLVKSHYNVAQMEYSMTLTYEKSGK